MKTTRFSQWAGVDAQAAGGAGLEGDGFGLGPAQGIEDGFDAAQVGGAGLGEGEAAAGAVEELDAEFGFEFADDARDRGGGEAGFAGGFGETAEAGGGDDEFHALEAVHVPSILLEFE